MLVDCCVAGGEYRTAYALFLIDMRDADQICFWWPTNCRDGEVKNPPSKDNAWQRQVTYPSVTQLDDGTLVAVWTDIGVNDDAHYRLTEEQIANIRRINAHCLENAKRYVRGEFRVVSGES